MSYYDSEDQGHEWDDYSFESERNNRLSKSTVEITIRGPVHFAKVLGDPIPNYNKDGREWKLDLELVDQATIKEVRSLGIGDRIKQKENYLDGAPHMTIKQKEYRTDGVTPNKPPKVVEADGKTPWNQERLIGNKSVCDVKLAVTDYGPGKKAGVYIRGVRVLDHVPYEKELFAPLSEDDEFFAKEEGSKEVAKALGTVAKPKKGRVQVDDDLDDEIPF